MKPQAKVIDDFFSDEILEDLQELSKETESLCFDDSFQTWEDYLIETSKNPCKIFDLNQEAAEIYADQTADLTKAIQDRLDTTCDVILRLYYWLPQSNIPWHDDGPYKANATVYLNEVWKEEWGGLFLYDIGEKNIGKVVPKINRCVWSTPGTLHCVTETAAVAPIRRTLQLRLI